MNKFSAQDIALKPCFRSETLHSFTHIPVPSEKICRVRGENLCFPPINDTRPYTIASFVNSVDGRLAFNDKPSAFYIAAKNMYAGNGSTADFWMLNALRCVADAALIGGNSMATDADYLMTVLDDDLQRDRISAGLHEHPLNIIMSLDCTDVPLEHELLKQSTVPRLLVTSPKGYAHIKAHLKIPYKLLEKDTPCDLFKAEKELPVFISGTDALTDVKEIMHFLRKNGIKLLLIEAPGYAHYLITQGMMDEFFLNRSGIYVGGNDTMVFGKHTKGFKADVHPHMKLLSFDIYNEFFTFGRYQFMYDDII
ncbi:dihydrofolate reductase family protein [Treponema sp. OMZ 840]|uniref:RibD family protein n=1 Tax=Treponema sp. OMZ 840 TaxID=244313 RepID=UPI003D904AD7